MRYTWIEPLGPPDRAVGGTDAVKLGDVAIGLVRRTPKPPRRDRWRIVIVFMAPAVQEAVLAANTADRIMYPYSPSRSGTSIHRWHFHCHRSKCSWFRPQRATPICSPPAHVKDLEGFHHQIQPRPIPKPVVVHGDPVHMTAKLVGQTRGWSPSHRHRPHPSWWRRRVVFKTSGQVPTCELFLDLGCARW